MINAETSTMGVPVVLDHEQANIKTATIAITVSFSTQVIEQARDTADTSWAETVPTKMQAAEDIIGRVINEQMNGAGDGLLAAITGGTSPGLTVTVGTSANWYQLYPGRIVDVLTRATGANPGAGKRRKIVSIDTTAGTVTLDTNATASDGQSGTVTFSAAEGIYIDNSYGNALAGLQGACATAGLFEGINKTNVYAWRGVDASPGAATDPTIAIFDRAERLAYQTAGHQPDFYLTDPAVLDKYTQGIATSARWNGDTVELSTGFTGCRYRNKLLMIEFDAAPRTAIGVSRDDATIYTLDDGPDWDNKTGAMFQRFTRSLPIEAWLVWMLQLGFTRCNTFVKVSNLNQAT